LLQRSENGKEEGGIARYAELFRTHPDVPKRVRALKLFAESSFYRKLIEDSSTEAPAGGLTAEEVDAKVSEIMSVF
jgi:hypothetical protein